MNTGGIRKQLHEYIDAADDKKIQAIFTLLETELHAPYSEADLKKFYERRQKHLDGGTAYTAEESHEYIRQSRKTK